MRKKLRQHAAQLNKLFFLLATLFFSVAAFSQVVTGTVSDSAQNPVAGVTIQVKGTNRSTMTNESGKFTISASGTDVLVLTSVGYVRREVSVSGNQTLNVTLANDSRNLGEVTVTALGISKRSRGLGYSATNVKPEEISVNRTANPINALEGKVAGVNISSLGTGPGGTSKVRIRGQSSITGGDNPLIVINGVPINSGNFNGSTVGVAGGGVYSDGGDSCSIH